jgi:hypothetical protein
MPAPSVLSAFSLVNFLPDAVGARSQIKNRKSKMRNEPSPLETDLILTKDPHATLDYGLDWSAWLADVPAGHAPDTIVASTWSIAGDDASLVSSNPTSDNTTTTTWLTGGTVNATYTLTNRITTAAGRTDNRSMRIRIVEK